MRPILTTAVALTALLAGLCCDAGPGRAAAGAEAWCLIDSEGNGHCNYATSQDCLGAVAGGSRGFCNENSSAQPAPMVQAARPRKRRS